ncbi:MAG TPA: enoyl-CoA hydratase-related protein [Candidatus Binataceae bacterium]|nr:enoyl-CoA hydratase-related protein [Candidatus Binataceae bacterium]
MANYTELLYEKIERTGRITLNRPRYRNAQSTVLLKELDRAFEAAALDDEIKVIILAGAGEHFSAGHDLGTPDEKENPNSYYNTKGLKNRHIRSWEIFLDNTLRWRDLPKPTIAQVQGFCIFGGYMFASAMDLIVASDDAMFLPSITQYFSAPWDVGVRKAKEILFQSRFIDAQEALRTGLANMVVPRADLEKETLALATRIAETDGFTLRMLKFAINNAQDEMGFHTAVRNAHSHHFLTRVQEYAAWDKGEGRGGPKRMPGVEQALRKAARGAAK